MANVLCRHSTVRLNEEKVTYELNPYNILNQMERLRSMSPNANITIEVIGRTIEYKDIVLLKITKAKSDVGKYYRATDSKYVDEIPEKKIIFIVHGLAVMGIHDIYCLSNENKFRQLVSYYLSHLDKFDIFLIPMANPDGYSLHSSEPNWNKNSSPLSPCLGVALDRNFDVAWNTSHGISTCSPHYPGSEPFSEAETRAIRDVFHRYSHKIIAYINVHGGSFNHEIFKGDAVLYPKGYTDVQSDDDKYIDLRGEIDEAIRNASFKIMSVTVDSLNNWYGKIQGSSVDYASTVYGIPYALEFVMQPYSYETSNAALVEIWKRLIDVVFINIWKSIHNNDV
ncbi:carboxypeptidase B-like [Achroia grisella]|uniref:carboxypeptidase B-like n=1 Tax=Achroia grisella TaxID=688607 RepID=UPI0027D31D1E|nr:carboxypeptidase B-like [Achroia grisella]